MPTARPSKMLGAGQMHEPGELEHSSWRYRIHTPRMCVVIAFDEVTRWIVVTAWEKKGAGRFKVR